MAVRLKGVLDRAALCGALNDLVGRHESLRTVYPERGGVPRQQIVAADQARPVFEVRALRGAELDGAVTAALGRGFELSRELPLRGHLYALSDAEGEQHALLVVRRVVQHAFRDRASARAARPRRGRAGIDSH